MPGRFSDILRAREFNDFFFEYHGQCFSVRTLDGWSWSPSPTEVPHFSAIFQCRETLDTFIEDAREATLGRIFLDGKLELDGNLVVLLSVAQYTLCHSEGLSRGLVQAISRLAHHFSKKLFPVCHASGNKNWHYSPGPLELPVSFFESWLGSFLGHSCCWFESDTDEFERAQRNLLERACAWLEVERGDWLLDLGCGWGSLLMHAAQACGAHTQGIASSHLQAMAASERIHLLGLSRQCSVECRDIRLNPYRSGEFDKVAHLGIFEQVGSPEFPEYLRCIWDLLAPGGLLLLHRMTKSPEAAPCIASLPSDFLSDGISRDLHHAERTGFDLLGLESLHAEYGQTLRIWIDRLLNARQGVTTRLYSAGYRAWLLYLIEVAASLNSGEMQVHRLLLRRRP